MTNTVITKKMRKASRFYNATKRASKFLEDRRLTPLSRAKRQARAEKRLEIRKSGRGG